MKSSAYDEKVQKQGWTFLALGDSYTIGEDVDESDRWPVQLMKHLEEKLPLQMPEIIATTGWTTDELLYALSTKPSLGEFDLVSLLIGVNNQYRAYPIEQFGHEFTLLLRKAIEYASGKADRVWVLSIPDYACTPFGAEKNPQLISSEIDLYNGLKQQISKEAGVNFLDITQISRLASDQSELIASDGLHPSGAMYLKWVDSLSRTILKVYAKELSTKT